MSAPDSTASLMGYMKLRDAKDPTVLGKIEAFVETQKVSIQVAPGQVPACRKASSLLMLRLIRSFQQRHAANAGAAAPKPTDATANATPSEAAKPSTTSTSPAAAGTTTGTSTATASTGATSTTPPKPDEATNGAAAKKSVPSLKTFMSRKVKVTKPVQEAVQFVGSDLLKVLQVLTNAPTIAEIVDTCLVILENETKIQEFYKALVKDAIKKEDGTPIDDESTSVFFGVFTLQSLQTLKAQAIMTFELAHDFDYMYQSCYKYASFEQSVNALNPTLPPTPPGSVAPPPKFAPDTEARNICWKFARLLALKQDHVSAKTDPDGKNRRRSHIISSVASILFAASLGQAKMSTKAASEGSNEPPNKKSKIDKTDFVNFASMPVSQLGSFIRSNANGMGDFTSISTAEIRSQLHKLYSSVDKLKIVRDFDKGAQPVKALDTSDVSISNAFSPEKVRFILQNYRSIIHDMASETQTNLQISLSAKKQAPESPPDNPGARLAIANVLMLFPMVLGEPWGIHRDAPKITTRLMCKWDSKKASVTLRDSVAVVLIPPQAKSTSPSRTPDAVMVDVGPPPTPPRPRAPSLVKNGELEPPVINDSMELNEWTLSILSLSVVKPSDSLLMYLGEADRNRGDGSSCLHDVIVPVLNRGLLRVQGAMRASNPRAPKDTRLTVGRKDGQVYVSGQVDEGIQLCASVVGFYYHSLEAIINDQMERMEFLGSFSSLLQSESFHRALLTCCYACTLKGAGTTHKIETNGSHKETTVHLLMETIESSPYTFLKVTEALRRALVVTGDPSKKKVGSPIVPGLPVILQKHLQKLEVQMVDSIVWATSSSSKSEGSLAVTIKTMKSLPGAWPPDVLESSLPEELLDAIDSSPMLIDEKYKPAFSSSTEASFLSYVLRKLLKIVFFRIQAICKELKLGDEIHVHTQILVAFRYLLRHNFEMFYDRHIDQLILCTVYGVCRVMRVKPEVTFARLMDAYIAVRKDDQGERACRVILRHVKLVANDNDFRPEGKVVGNLITFYNQVYVPKMQRHFTASASLKKAGEDYRKTHPFASRNGASVSASPPKTSTTVTPSTTNGGVPPTNGNVQAKPTENGTTTVSLKPTPGDKPKDGAASNGAKVDEAVVIANADGKEVKESQAVNGAAQSEKGAQKRSFVTMGGATS